MRDVVRDVVVKVAPEELPVVDGLARFDDATVVRRLGRPRRREPLGFGVGEIVGLVTAVVWLVLNQAIQEATGSAVNGAAKRMKGILHRVSRRPVAPVVVPRFTPEQLAEIRRRLLEAAARQGLEEERATAVANEVVTRLALPGPHGDGSGDPQE